MTRFDETVHAWPRHRFRESLEALLVRADLAVEHGRLHPMPAKFADTRELMEWLLSAPLGMGVESELHSVPRSELASLLREQQAAMFQLPQPDGSVRFVAVIVHGSRCVVLLPNGGEVRFRTAQLATEILARRPEEKQWIQNVLRDLPGGSDAALQLMRVEQEETTKESFVSFKRDSATSLWGQLREQRGGRALAGLVVLSALRTLLVGGAAFALGQAALDGLVDLGRVIAWTLASLATVPLSYWITLLAGRLTLAISAIVRRRTLEGTFHVSEDVLRREGYGASLAKLNEASVVERTSVLELFAVFGPLALLATALGVFATSAVPLPFLTLTLAFLAGAAVVAWRYNSAYTLSYRLRLSGTEDVADKVIGHRTRAAQEHPARRHVAEDRLLVAYQSSLVAVDQLGVAAALLGRIWMTAAGCFLLYFFVRGDSLATLSLPALGTVLVTLALNEFAGFLSTAVAWYAAWRAIEPLFAAGIQRERPRREEENPNTEELPTALAASTISFSYRPGGRPVLTDASIRIARGERVLVEGRSGGGKTTFVKLVAGELKASGGTLLLSGLDPSSSAQSQWRELVASVPQFHENHVFGNTFSFNVDPKYGSSGLTRDAQEICEELGLGEVLSKMPSGAAQLLGETGWHLSHGERSRVFVARALLQNARVVIFDESFAALDPITLARVIECVRKRALTLLVIAHT